MMIASLTTKQMRVDFNLRNDDSEAFDCSDANIVRLASCAERIIEIFNCNCCIDEMSTGGISTCRYCISSFANLTITSAQ